MTDYNVAIIEVDERGRRTLRSRSVENRDFVADLANTMPPTDTIIKVWRVGDLASEAVYEAQGWL